MADPRHLVNNAKEWTRLTPCLLLVFLIAFNTFADFVKAPASISREKGSIVVSEKGKPRWSADFTMEPFTVDGKPGVRFTEKGRGLYSPFKTEVQWTLEALWRADGNYRPVRFEKTFTDASGKVLATHKKSFDDAKGIALFDGKSFNAPPDTLTIEGAGGVFRSLPFESGKPFKFHMLTNEPRLYEASIEPRGKERVKVPAGEFECYKMEVVPHLGALDVVKPFLPKTYFWFAVEAPHFWVKFQGFENGIGSPQIVMELQSRAVVR